MKPLVGVVMGSESDWNIMQNTAEMLDALRIPYEVNAMSAHRTPDLVIDYAAGAEERGLKVIIAAAGGAAHLGGVIAAKTSLPVIGVPMESQSLKGLDSLLSMVQMPSGIPVATVAIGKAGANNAAILAAEILALSHEEIKEAVKAFRTEQTRKLTVNTDPRT